MHASRRQCHGGVVPQTDGGGGVGGRGRESQWEMEFKRWSVDCAQTAFQLTEIALSVLRREAAFLRSSALALVQFVGERIRRAPNSRLWGPKRYLFLSFLCFIFLLRGKIHFRFIHEPVGIYFLRLVGESRLLTWLHSSSWNKLKNVL